MGLDTNSEHRNEWILDLSINTHISSRRGQSGFSD
jgi:hypothetical protein